ncbi:hypothetical protein, partial [Escherichia coli]|uniref:hypothetical protein n=1 Tax=Escherichia coli TaxID=562 RepID=UPI003F283622
MVPRETPQSESTPTRATTPAFTVRTAADLADLPAGLHDESTPLARAAEHSVLARHGARLAAPAPR